ncbi:hypothetical protein Taro_002220 [Colocasia esculenta]|uniref:Uncharacterized protein n=1 Tax=Colocasia esculenta TaxID=4460 RepID=A0A843TK45_COLES|nr:hypothetical protein [Colocasia esculenta]
MKRCPYAIASAACDRAPGEEFGRRTGNLRMRPFSDRVKVRTLNWGLAGGYEPRANKYPRTTGGGNNWASSASECRFRIGVL